MLKVLVGLDNSNLIAKKIIEKKLSVRQTEALVRLYKNPTKQKSTAKSANIKDLEESLKSKLGIRVLIKNKKTIKVLLVLNIKT